MRRQKTQEECEGVRSNGIARSHRDDLVPRLLAGRGRGSEPVYAPGVLGRGSPPARDNESPLEAESGGPANACRRREFSRLQADENRPRPRGRLAGRL